MPQDPAFRERAGVVVPPATDAHSSSALILRARDGDVDARNELCARYLPRLRRWAHGRLPPWAREHLDTEDIVQDTLMQSMRQLPAFTPHHERAFCAYVSQALRNRLRDAMRRATTRPVGQALPVDLPAQEPSPLEYAVGGQMLVRYDAALQRLSERDRELIVARVELALGYEEIAGLLELSSIPSARVAVSRALVRLAMVMGVDRTA